MTTIQFTQEGFDNLKTEYDELINTKRAKAVSRLALARSMGDLSENSEYTAAKEELSFVEGRIQELEELMKNAVVADSKNTAKGRIDIGCKVQVEKNGQKEEYTIVGEFEANPLEKKLSHTSPIGKALIGKKKGDSIAVEVPVGKLVYKIIEVHEG